MSERVDKGWHSKGIETYSIPAILGTLAHYGVTVTEEGFLALAKDDFPLAIAHGWHEHWKGTGQFSRFPAAAAEELWRRLKSGDTAPTDVALAVVNLLTTLDDALSGKADDGTWDTRFKVVEAYLPRIPAPASGEMHDKFLGEMSAALGSEWMDVLDGMAEALVKKAQPALADRFAVLEESLFPFRAGTAQALVQAAKGDVEGAMVKLRAIANEGDPFTRLSAIDALHQHDQVDASRQALLALVEVAAQKRDVELAGEVADRISELLEANLPRAIREEFETAVDRLDQVFGA